MDAIAYARTCCALSSDVNMKVLHKHVEAGLIERACPSSIAGLNAIRRDNAPLESIFWDRHVAGNDGLRGSFEWQIVDCRI